MKMLVAPLLVLGLALASCDSAASYGPEDEDTDITTSSDDSDREFGGYECTDDCSGHEAGAAWAEDHGIDDPDDCGGKSQSFEEGCRAYAEGEASGEDF